MSSADHKEELLKRFKDLGIQRGDAVFLHTQLFAFGELVSNKDEYCRIFLDPLKEAVGYPDGTIAALTYTTSFGSRGEPFVYETSKSEAGMLTEYIRTLPEAIRSLHPLGSIAAIGNKAVFICKNISRSQFGWNSVYHRLHQVQAKCLYLGLTVGDTCTFMHYVEHLYGVSHAYHKAYFHPVYSGGKLQRAPFLSFVRNRKSTPYDFLRFQDHLRSKKMVRESEYNGAPLQVVSTVDCFDEGMKLLDENPSYFIKEPFYITE